MRGGARAPRRRRPLPSSSASRCSSCEIRSERALIASAIGSGRWIQSASGPSTRRPSTLTGWPGLPTTVESGRDILDDDGVCADLRAVADRDRSQQLRPGADRHVVAQGRVALAGLQARAPERHALIEGHAVADLCRLADHDSRAVVDEELRADPGRGMDLYPGDRPAHVGDRAGQQRNARAWQTVCQPVGEQRLHPSPAREDLERGDAVGRRIAVARRGNVRPDLVDHAFQGRAHGRPGEKGGGGGCSWCKEG